MWIGVWERRALSVTLFVWHSFIFITHTRTHTLSRQIDRRGGARAQQADAMVGQQVEAMPPSYDVRSQSWSADTCHPIKAHSAGVGCACKASIGDASAAGAAAPMGGWGLPTSSCPISPYLRDELPALHVQWMQQDRVLYHCPDAGGFGDWLRGASFCFSAQHNARARLRDRLRCRDAVTRSSHSHE